MYKSLLTLSLTWLLLGVLPRAAAQNVGIGTMAPTQSLDVNGGLRVRGLQDTDTRLPVVQPDGTLGVSASVYGTSPAAVPVLPTTARSSPTAWP